MSASIYIHIPFCKSKCVYCDFYSITQASNKELFIKIIEKEIELERNFFENEQISTIYFGGGTPSLLNADEINKIIEKLAKTYKLQNNLEITLEANPDDLSKKYLKQLTTTAVNRLSIGVQSFSNDDLKFLKRRHTAQQSKLAILQATELGFNNISIDLIFAIPNTNLKKWEDNLNTAFSLPIKHLSAYNLTIEPQTKLFQLYKTNKFSEIKEEEYIKQYYLLLDITKKNNFEQYEISNFADKNFQSQHNQNYWNGTKYLGLGPSAHSYNIENRYYNIANITEYLKAIEQGNSPKIAEKLNIENKFNEYILTRLRTSKGVDLQYIQENFEEKYFDILKNNSTNFIQLSLLEQNKNIIYLTNKGKVVVDRIILELVSV